MTIKHLFPPAWPTVNFDFANSKALDPRITHTRDSIGTYIDENGILQYAAENEPRFDHDGGTGESLGLLIEEARTNELLFSTLVPENNYWKYQGLSRVSTNEPAPDGSNTAILCTAPDGPGDKTMYRGLDLNGYGLTTFSFYAKAANPGTGQQALISYFAGESENTLTGWLNLDNGKIENISGQRGDAVFTRHYAGNGWWRLELTLTPTGIHSYKWNIGLKNLDSAFLWGAQLEEGSFASSYIPTSGAAVDRSEDLVTADLTGDVPDEYTIITKPFGCASGKEDLSIYGYPHVQTVKIYPLYVPQDQINTVAKVNDVWRWRVLGSSWEFNPRTDGPVTVDWGDGTTESLLDDVKVKHTFTNGGGYHEVGFRLDSGGKLSITMPNELGVDRVKMVAVGPMPANMFTTGYLTYNYFSNVTAWDANIVHGNGSDLQRTYAGLTSLKSFPFTVLDPLITSFSQTWSDCSNLNSFPLIDTSSIESFGEAWKNCSSLTSFPHIVTSSGTKFNSTWSGCSSLTSFPLLDTSSGTNFSFTWSGCSNLANFPLLNTSLGENFQEAWRNCTNIDNTSLGETYSFPLIDTSLGTNFSFTWTACSNLTSFPPLDTSSGTNFRKSWSGCGNLDNITSLGETYSFPLIDTSLGENFEGSWNNCSSLTSFPPLDTSSGEDFKEAWSKCSNLTNFPLLDTSSGTNFQSAWNSCSSLNSFPLIDTSSGTNFQGTWGSCSNLNSFPLLDTSLGENFQSAWNSCSNLTSFPLLDTSSGTNFQSTWNRCSGLTSFPPIDASSGEKFQAAWQYCSNLTSFPAGFFDSWSPSNVLAKCFYNTWNACTSLTPASVSNILESLAVAGVAAPTSTGTDDKHITISWDGTGDPATASAAAITTLKALNWEIYLNGVLQ